MDVVSLRLPISVLGNNFTRLMQQYTDESVIVTQADLDGSGFVDLPEVARWLAAMRRAGKVRDERVTAEELVRRYDKGGKVGLERREFLRMCRETVHVGGPSNRELLQKMSTRRRAMRRSRHATLTPRHTAMCHATQPHAAHATPHTPRRARHAS